MDKKASLSPERLNSPYSAFFNLTYRIGVPFLSIFTYGQYICGAMCIIISASSPLSTISTFSSDSVWINAPGTS